MTRILGFAIFITPTKCPKIGTYFIKLARVVFTALPNLHYTLIADRSLQIYRNPEPDAMDRLGRFIRCTVRTAGSELPTGNP